MSMVLAIDPGASMGCSVWLDGKYVKSFTFKPLDLLDYLRYHDTCDLLVVIEDSTLQTHVWTGQRSNPSLEVAVKIARNVGEIDCYCKLIKDLCEQQGIRLVGISPKTKGVKITTNQTLSKKVGYETKTHNQHERDSVLIGHLYRQVNLNLIEKTL